MNGCKIVHENLFAYTEGNLSDTIQSQFDAHVSDCAQCAALLSGFKSVINTIEDQKNIEPRPFAETRILHGIEQKLEAKHESQFMVFTKVLQPAIFSIGLVAAILIGLFIGYQGVNVSNAAKEREAASVRSELNVPDIIYDESFTLTE